MAGSVTPRALLWPCLGALPILPSSLACFFTRRECVWSGGSIRLAINKPLPRRALEISSRLVSNESLPRRPEPLPGHRGSITYTYLHADKRCGGAEVFEDQNILQQGTLTSCRGTLTSAPSTPSRPLPDSLVREIVPKGQRLGILFSSTRSQADDFVFFSCLFKCITLMVWTHVKATYSSCIHFFFKHQRHPFQRNK